MNALSEITAAPPAVRAVPLKFMIGARTLFAVERRLVRVALSLAEARLAVLPTLPPLPADADGYIVTSLPEALLPQFGRAFVRQRYTRYWLDFAGGFDAWFETLSSNARQGLRRKARKLAAQSGGTLDIRRFRTPAELSAFHAIAREVSQRTYQERLLDSGLPEDAGFIETMRALAAAGRVRTWLLYVADAPIAYLYCPAQGDTLIYAHVGHDPAFNDLSPGAVLQLEAVRDLFAEGAFISFDFTEGEGQHKRQFASGGVACADLLLLRPTLANRALLAALRGFDGAVALAKRAVQRGGFQEWTKRVRRG
ncbi:GNAT family N-acetyltransferase [Sphingomonas sp. MMS12-HWE2-04]|uniref:GNAT family N-acetyltransferase n=1 Tax=Sphingomonas sp. MMS12-HWE2-04 TaxID=3234199 RepID=UPI00384B1324